MLWKAIAWVVSRKPIADYIIRRAQRTPYFHLAGYMDRWWVFNPYGNDHSMKDSDRHNSVRFKSLPSIRVHHILRADLADDMHDHPWDARTIILKGWYVEERLGWQGHANQPYIAERERGDTATLKFQEFHNVKEVSEGGVWTLFFTWKYQGGWGFLVNGRKVPWQEYTTQRTD